MFLIDQLHLPTNQGTDLVWTDLQWLVLDITPGIDAVLGFEHRQEAELFLEQLRERLGKYGLELHPEKTRLIEFERYAAERRKKELERNGHDVSVH